MSLLRATGAKSSMFEKPFKNKFSCSQDLLIQLHKTKNKKSMGT